MCHGSRLIKENISINGCFDLITNKNNDTLYSEHISFTHNLLIGLVGYYTHPR